MNTGVPSFSATTALEIVRDIRAIAPDALFAVETPSVCGHELGYVPEAELAQVYGMADCTLMPSLDLEGFGLATVESLACGTPVLASNAGANPELVGPLDKELLYPAGDSVALSQRLKAILEGSQRMPSRNRCVDYARETFLWDRPVGAFERIWERYAVRST